MTMAAIYSPKMLDITDAVLEKLVKNAVNQVAAISLSVGIPNAASVPHLMVNAYKRLVAITLGTDYSFPAADKIKEALKNPQAFAPVAQAASTSAAAPAAAAAPAKVEKEESDEEMGMGLFD